MQECLLVVPRTRNKTNGPRGFYYTSSTVWNSFPDNLRDPEFQSAAFNINLKHLKYHFNSNLVNVYFTLKLLCFAVRSDMIIY